MKMFKKLLCRIFKHKFYSIDSIPSLALDMLSQEGYVNYKCSRCGKISRGYFFQDRFRTLSWHRLLTEEEKALLINNPYCFLSMPKSIKGEI